MATFKIACADCGSEHEASNRTTKYCNVCRVFRDLAFVGTTTKNCFACSEAFAPIRRKDELCSKCDYNHRVYGTGTCGICKAENVSTIRMDIAVCVDCMRDPNQRRTFMKAMAKKRAERMEVK